MTRRRFLAFALSAPVAVGAGRTVSASAPTLTVHALVRDMGQTGEDVRYFELADQDGHASVTLISPPQAPLAAFCDRAVRQCRMVTIVAVAEET